MVDGGASVDMSCTAGIDIGSITAKAAVMRDGLLLGSRVIFTGYNAEAAGRRVFEELLGELGLDRAGDRPDRRHRLRPEERDDGRQGRHRDHVPRRRGALPRPFRPVAHRHRRAGQQGRRHGRKRAGDELHDERQMRRGDRPFPRGDGPRPGGGSRRIRRALPPGGAAGARSAASARSSPSRR